MSLPRTNDAFDTSVQDELERLLRNAETFFAKRDQPLTIPTNDPITETSFERAPREFVDTERQP
jgi:hypothetical protein